MFALLQIRRLRESWRNDAAAKAPTSKDNRLHANQDPGWFDLQTALAGLPLLSGIEPHLLATLAAEFEWFSLPGGQTLFHEGDKDDCLYIVLAGRLGAFARNEDGHEILIRQMLAGETVGEMALLSGEPRSATVVALRDSELLRLGKAGFTKLIEEHPKALRFITELLVRRLREPRSNAANEAAKTLAVVPLAPGAPSSAFVRLLQQAFEGLGMSAAVVDKDSATQPVEWFNALEEANGVVLYQAEFEPSNWTRLCLRQADRLVLLVHAAHSAVRHSPLIESTLQDTRRVPCELVLFHDGDRVTNSSDTPDLLKRFERMLAHNVRAAVPRDLRRLARLLSGRALGLVLSGGGARGFAHIGVIRALREAGIELDLFGGTSMGSIVAAGAALEWSDEELRERLRVAFSDANPVSDYTIPLIALVRGRKASRALHQYFGEQRIEDSPCSFFCVSSNLSTGRLKVHRTGLIWRALRASTSIPGVLPPVVEGADLLIDGGFLNNLPFEIMREMRRGQIVAVNVSRDRTIQATIDDLDRRPLWQLAGHARRGTPNIITVLMAAGTLSGMLKSKALRDSVDLLIEPSMATVSMLDWKSFDAAVEAGYRTAMDVLEKDWHPNAA
jgi:NTE family protein